MSAARPYRGVSHRDLLRWAVCFITVLSIHGAVAAALLRAPAEEGDTFDTTTAIDVDFTTESFHDAVAREVDLDEELTDAVCAAAPVHDIGKLAIPDCLLHRPGPLTHEEYEIVQQHAAMGAEILGQRSAKIHVIEHVDGSGEGVVSEIELRQRCDTFARRHDVGVESNDS